MLTLQAILLPLVILFCGLSVDVAMLEVKKAQMQAAADSAALGAANEAERETVGTTSQGWVNAGKADAAINGFTDGVNNVSITVTQQPSSGAYANRYDALQATITQQVQTVFMGAVNGGKVTISATATALLTPCVYLTGTTLQTYAFDGATGDMKGDSCPVNINNNAETAYTSLAPEATNIAGPAGNSSLAGYTWPTPNYNAPAVTDPLAYITSPSFSGTCNHNGYAPYNVSTALTLSPGTYCGGLNITNCSNVTLSPGLYVITGGGTWYNSTITGTGVTLYFTSGGGSTDSKFILSQSTVTLSAPNASSGGSIAGVLVFTDRHWTHSNPQDVDIMNSAFTGDGIWYLPSTGLYVYNSGVVTGTNYFGIDADNLTTSGTSIRLLNNYSSVQTGNPFRTQGALVQ
jgi:hypothetical protein